MDDSAIKFPTSVTLVHAESNAVDEKQLHLERRGCDFNPCKRSADLRAGDIGGVDSYGPARRVNLGPL